MEQPGTIPPEYLTIDFKQNVAEVTSFLTGQKAKNPKYANIREDVISSLASMFAIIELQSEINKGLAKVNRITEGNPEIKAKVEQMKALSTIADSFLSKIKSVTNFPTEIISKASRETIMDVIYDNHDMICKALDAKISQSDINKIKKS